MISVYTFIHRNYYSLCDHYFGKNNTSVPVGPKVFAVKCQFSRLWFFLLISSHCSTLTSLHSIHPFIPLRAWHARVLSHKNQISSLTCLPLMILSNLNCQKLRPRSPCPRTSSRRRFHVACAA